MNVKLKPEKYLRYLVPLNLFGTKRTREIIGQNPTVLPYREDSKEVKISVHDYNATSFEVYDLKTVEECFQFFIRQYYKLDKY